jgi:hypothetical protein
VALRLSGRDSQEEECDVDGGQGVDEEKADEEDSPGGSPIHVKYFRSLESISASSCSFTGSWKYALARRLFNSFGMGVLHLIQINTCQERIREHGGGRSTNDDYSFALSKCLLRHMRSKHVISSQIQIEKSNIVSRVTITSIHVIDATVHEGNNKCKN